MSVNNSQLQTDHIASDNFMKYSVVRQLCPSSWDDHQNKYIQQVSFVKR